MVKQEINENSELLPLKKNRPYNCNTNMGPDVWNKIKEK